MDNYDVKDGERKSQLHEMIVPPLAAWVLYFLLGAIVLLVINFHGLWQFTTDHIIGPPDEVGPAGYAEVLAPVFNFTNKLNTPLLMLFWAVVGLFTYFVVFMIEQVLFIVSREVRQSKYLQGGILPIRNYWKTSLKTNLFFVALLIIWVIFFAFYVEAALPWLSKLLLSGVYYQLSSIRLLFEITVSLVGNMLCIYVFLLISRILHNSWVLVRD